MGLFFIERFFIEIIDLSERINPLHLLGLKGLMGTTEIFFESKFKIGPWTERLYAVLPAGVETINPSATNFFINVLEFFFYWDKCCLFALS